jgi:hypothetical protein
MRLALKIVIVVLYVLLLCEMGLWVVFGAPPLAWHGWYLVIFPLAAFVFWPGKRDNK